MTLTLVVTGLVACATPAPSNQSASTHASNSGMPIAENALDPSPSDSVSPSPEGSPAAEPAPSDAPKHEHGTDDPEQVVEVVQNPDATNPAPGAQAYAASPPAPAPAAPKAPAPGPAAPSVPPVAVPAPHVPPAPEPAPVQSEYAQLVQNIVAPWCGNVNVLVDDPSVVSGDVYGMSWWRTNKLGIRSGIPMVITKDIALHECGHMLQARVYPNRYEAILRLNQIYGTDYGIETNARCISAYLHPIAAPAGVGTSTAARFHGGECAGAFGEAAIKIVQGSRP